jgi:hypothetical protein
MEELRREYESCNLSDSQILTAKAVNITPEQIHAMRKAIENASYEFNKLFEVIVDGLRTLTESESWRKLVELLEEPKTSIEIKIEAKKNKKGKSLKLWEKRNFYD